MPLQALGINAADIKKCREGYVNEDQCAVLRVKMVKIAFRRSQSWWYHVIPQEPPPMISKSQDLCLFVVTQRDIHSWTAGDGTNQGVSWVCRVLVICAAGFHTMIAFVLNLAAPVGYQGLLRSKS